MTDMHELQSLNPSLRHWFSQHLCEDQSLTISDQARVKNMNAKLMQSFCKAWEAYQNDQKEHQQEVLEVADDEKLEDDQKYYFGSDNNLRQSVEKEVQNWQFANYININVEKFYLHTKGSLTDYPFFAFVVAYHTSKLDEEIKSGFFCLVMRLLVQLSALENSQNKVRRFFDHIRLLLLSDRNHYENMRAWWVVCINETQDLKIIWKELETFKKNTTDITLLSLIQFWISCFKDIRRKKLIKRVKISNQNETYAQPKYIDALKKPIHLLFNISSVPGKESEPVDPIAIELPADSGLSHFLEDEAPRFSQSILNQIMKDQSYIERASVCNDHYFDPSSGQILFKTLLLEFEQTKNHKDRSMLSALILSFLTGSVIEHFVQSPKENQEKWQINEIGSHLICRWKIALEITCSNRLENHGNDQMMWVRLPQSFVKSLCIYPLGQTKSSQYIEIFLKNIVKKHRLRIGPVSLSRIQRHLKFVLENQFSSQYISNVLAQTPTNLAVGTYYGQSTKSQVEMNYQTYVRYITGGKDSLDLDIYLNDKVFNSEIHQHEEYATDDYIGSQFVPRLDAVKEVFEHLRKNLQSSSNILNYFNAYSCWIWHLSLLFLAARPVTGAPGYLPKLDLDQNIFIVSDKQQRVGQDNSRILYIHPFLQRHLEQYLDYLKLFFNKYARSYPELYQIWVDIQRGEIPITHLIDLPKRLKKEDHNLRSYWDLQQAHVELMRNLKEGMFRPVQRSDMQWTTLSGKKWSDNWHRHFCYSYLVEYRDEQGQSISTAILNQIMGHEAHQAEFLNPKTSSASLLDIRNIRKALDKLVLQLDLPEQV